MATMYFKLFPHSRIVGIIDVGGAPIRFYPIIAQNHKIFLPMGIDFIR